jgi:hypothetical protein
MEKHFCDVRRAKVDVTNSGEGKPFHRPGYHLIKRSMTTSQNGATGDDKPLRRKGLFAHRWPAKGDCSRI